MPGRARNVPKDYLISQFHELRRPQGKREGEAAGRTGTSAPVAPTCRYTPIHAKFAGHCAPSHCSGRRGDNHYEVTSRLQLRITCRGSFYRWDRTDSVNSCEVDEVWLGWDIAVITARCISTQSLLNNVIMSRKEILKTISFF